MSCILSFMELRDYQRKETLQNSMYRDVTVPYLRQKLEHAENLKN